MTVSNRMRRAVGAVDEMREKVWPQEAEGAREEVLSQEGADDGYPLGAVAVFCLLTFLGAS